VLTFILDGPILFGAPAHALQRRRAPGCAGRTPKWSFAVSVLIHELAHCAVARHYGAEITHISLWCAPRKRAGRRGELAGRTLA
jgi:hypothetical protein